MVSGLWNALCKCLALRLLNIIFPCIRLGEISAYSIDSEAIMETIQPCTNVLPLYFLQPSPFLWTLENQRKADKQCSPAWW